MNRERYCIADDGSIEIPWYNHSIGEAIQAGGLYCLLAQRNQKGRLNHAEASVWSHKMVITGDGRST